MKNFNAKIIVKLKDTIKDVKGLTLKGAVESLLPLQNLSCRVGNFYSLNFLAENEDEAKNYVDKIAQEILSNGVIETYEIFSIEEIYK